MLLLQPLAPHSSSACLLSLGRSGDKDPPAPVQHPGMSKAMHIKGVGRSTADTIRYLAHCHRFLFKGTNQSIPLPVLSVNVKLTPF